MVIIRSFKQRPVCTECQMKSFSVEITDPKFKKLFNIDPKFYEVSGFLRDIRYQYSKYHNLTEKQIAAFKKVVDELKNPKKKEEQAKVIEKKVETGKPKLFRGERTVLRALRTR